MMRPPMNKPMATGTMLTNGHKLLHQLLNGLDCLSLNKPIQNSLNLQNVS